MLIGKGGILTRLRTGRPKDWGSIPGEGEDSFRYSVHTESRAYQVYYPVGIPGHKAVEACRKHLSPARVES